MTSNSGLYRWRKFDIILGAIFFALFFNAFFHLFAHHLRDQKPTLVDLNLKCPRPLSKNSLLKGVDGPAEINQTRDKTFLEIAKETKTSKVTDVRYQCMYEDALAPYRKMRGLKILEIGLGCAMPYGEGASFTLWTSYFLDPHITFFEYDENCGRRWFSKLKKTIEKDDSDVRLPKMVYGDQTNVTMLKQMARKLGPWDIIIDDGCHDPTCQIPAFQTLFEYVKPGGTYFAEDLFAWASPPSDLTIAFIAQFYQISIAQTYAKKLKAEDAAKVDWTPPGLKFDSLHCCDAICAIRAKRET